jgi:phenylacetate-coenzyme A ligase PaaK-like adenylate-forming protein
MDPGLHQAIFHIKDHRTFGETALKVFRFQAASVPVYRDYLSVLKVNPENIQDVEEIPFLPVEFFKSRQVICQGMEPELVFESSGTTLANPSRHYVARASLYRNSFLRGFSSFYGEPEKRCILALLPSYLERSGSSLVYMMDHLTGLSEHPDSGFYLDNLEDLSSILKKRNVDGYPTLLMGVSFALLDLAERYPVKLGNSITVMETGGMKGRRQELIRDELHEILTRAFGISSIHSEYGMTELMSQAYSSGRGIFFCPPWMDVLVRDPNDPLSLLGEEQSGGLNVIDLANLYSCAFIATGDLGKRHPDGSFEVLGRFDQSDIRGCNLLVS